MYVINQDFKRPTFLFLSEAIFNFLFFLKIPRIKDICSLNIGLMDVFSSSKEMALLLLSYRFTLRRQP